MTTNKDHAGAFRRFLAHGSYPGVSALRAAIALLDPPQPEPTTDAAEREHCRRAVQRELPCEQTQPKWCVDMLLRERAAVRHERDHEYAKFTSERANEHNELRAETERLRAEYDTDHELLIQVVSALETKHTALVKAARAVDEYFADEDRTIAAVRVLETLRLALEGEP